MRNLFTISPENLVHCRESCWNPTNIRFRWLNLMTKHWKRESHATMLNCYIYGLLSFSFFSLFAAKMLHTKRVGFSFQNVTLSDSPVIVPESIFAAALTKPSWGELLSAIESDVMAGRPIELQPVSTLVASLPDRNPRNSWKFQPFLLEDQTLRSFSTYNRRLAAIIVNGSSIDFR